MMRFLTVSLLASSVLLSTQADALSFRDAHLGTPTDSAFKKIGPQLKSSRAWEDALRRAAPKPKTYDDQLKDLQSRVDKAPRIGHQKERRVNSALANELLTFAEQAKSKRKWGHTIWALESAYSVADARQKPTIQSKITSARLSSSKWSWDYEIAPQVDHALKVLANRHVRKVMPKAQQEQLAQRITCIMDTGMYDLQFARSEIGRVRTDLEIYNDFLPCAAFDETANGPATKAYNALRTKGTEAGEQQKVAFVRGAPAVFKAGNHRHGINAALMGNEQRGFRDTRREFLVAQLAYEMGLGHTVAPVALIGSGASYRTAGSIEQCIPVFTAAQKTIMVDRATYMSSTGSLTLNTYGDKLRTAAGGNIYYSPARNQCQALIDQVRSTDMANLETFSGRTVIPSVQNLQDLFIVTFVTKQMDATKRNLMVDMTSNPDNPRLVITDTEYSMSESQRVQWFGAGQYAEVYKYDPAILTMSGAYQMLTEDTLRKIRALDRGRLVATVKEFYPDLSAEDLRTFEKRINFLKENAEVLRYKGLEGIWNEYFTNGNRYGQDGKKIVTTPSHGGYGNYGSPSVPSAGAGAGAGAWWLRNW